MHVTKSSNHFMPAHGRSQMFRSKRCHGDEQVRLKNGAIYTIDSKNPTAQAIAIKGKYHNVCRNQ